MFNRLVLLWILFAGVMGFALGGSLVWSIYSPQQTQHEHNTADNANQAGGDNREKSQSLWMPTDSIGLYTLVLAAFTGLLFVTSAFQGYFLIRADKTARITAEAAQRSAESTDKLWDAGERQLAHLSETAERQLRAYVFVIEAKLTTFEIGVPVKCKIIIENTGQTPAYGLTHAAVMGLAKFPPEGPFPEACEAVSKTNLGPGAHIDKFGGRDVPLTETELNTLNTGWAALYLFGRIDFVDAFNNARWVKYRYMTGGNAGVHGKSLAICQEGNETSEG